MWNTIDLMNSIYQPLGLKWLKMQPKHLADFDIKTCSSVQLVRTLTFMLIEKKNSLLSLIKIIKVEKQ